MPSTEPIRVGVFGAGGRMGQTLCAALAGTEDLELVAAVDPAHQGERALAGTALLISGEREAMVAAGAQVAVDFSVKEAAPDNLAFCAEHGLHAVCGTTGIEPKAIEQLRQQFSGTAGSNCVLAPNFAISAVLMVRLAALAAPFFDSVEIVELHHDHKRDAPSGTAIATAVAIETARTQAGASPLTADPTSELAMPGARGARSDGGVQLHSVRLAGLVAHQEVLFGTAGQSLTIRQDSYDRSSFMPGVLLAIRRVASTPGFTLGLEGLLGL